MRKFSDHQWLQFDLGPATQVTGMVTRGQGDRKRFVTSYTMAYSNDSVTWHEYKDSNHLEAKVSLFAPLPMQYDQFVVVGSPVTSKGKSFRISSAN